jgi:SAM-dependent methyltransferase
MSEDASIYLHGSDPDEQRRLARLNDLINERCLSTLKLKGGERILDVGSGLGQFTRLMAKTAEAVVGVERSEEQLQESLRLAKTEGENDKADFRLGDATALPLLGDEWGSFDVVHSRFVLEHVRDPLAVVRQMAMAAKPGGRIVISDDGHDTLRLWPRPTGFAELWTAYMRTYDRVGNDPLVGHRLVSLLVEAGLEPTFNTWVFFGACAGEKDVFAAYADNLVRVIDGVKPQILALGEFDDPSFDDRIRHIRDWSRRPDAAIWYALSWAEGRKP